MNTVDVLVLVVLILNGVLGAFRGFVSQAFRIGSLILAFVLSRRYASDLSDRVLSIFLDEPTLRIVIAYLIILAAVYFLMVGLAHLLRGLLQRARLSSADRSLGFLFGLLKGAFFTVLAFQVILVFFPMLTEGIRAQLMGAPGGQPPPSQAFTLHRRWVSQSLNEMIPQSMKEDVLRGLEDARKR